MKKILLAILIVVMWCGVGWGAAISKTVCASGGDYTTMKGAVDYIRTNGDGASTNTITVCAGTFSSANDYIKLDHANLANLVIQGAGMDVTTIDATLSGVQTLWGSANSSTNLVVNDLTLSTNISNKSVVYKHADAGIWNFNRVHFIAGAAQDTYNIYLLGDTTNFSKCRITKNALYVLGDGDGTITYTIKEAAGYSSTGGSGFILSGSGTYTISNNLILDSSTHGVWVTAGTVNLYNNIISSGLVASNSYPINRTGGTVTADGNLLIAGPWSPDNFVNGTVTEGGTLANLKTSLNPYFINYGRKGYIIPRIDDSGGFAYAQAVETKLAAYGYKGVLFLTVFDWNAANTAALKTMATNGTIEIGSHSYSHSDITFTGNIFTLNGNVTISSAANTIVSAGGTLSNYKTMTLGDIKTALEAAPHSLTVTPVAAYDTTTAGTIQADALGSIIADGVGVAAIAVDVDRYMASELVDSKSALETLIGGSYSCDTFGYPYNASNVTTRTAVINSGYVQAITSKATYTTPSFINDLDIFDVFTLDCAVIKGDGAEATVRKNTRSLAFAVAQSGLAVGFMSHSLATFSSDEWDWFLDELSKFGNNIHVTSPSQMVAEIKASWTDDTDGTWSKTLGYSNFKLKPNSPARNTGTDVFLTSDFAGRLVPQGTAPDIGAYEYWPISGGLGMGGKGMLWLY